MKLKVCGITSVEQLEELRNMNVDFAGLIFVRSSPRYAYKKLFPHTDKIRKSGIQKVGVFVNETMETVKMMISEFGLDLVQLHGDETPEYANELNKHIPVIKAFRISGGVDVPKLIKPFVNAGTYFLFDTLSNIGSYGGTGNTFDWDMLPAKIDKPFFLSGGISPSHIGSIRALSHPSLFAADINSKFETAPGVKDLGLVRSFKEQLDQSFL